MTLSRIYKPIYIIQLILKLTVHYLHKIFTNNYKKKIIAFNDHWLHNTQLILENSVAP